MTKTNKQWKFQGTKFTSKHIYSLQNQHLAAQYLALIGRYLIDQQDDDSNTNMKFLKQENDLVGREFSSGNRLALNLDDLELKILDQENAIVKTIQLSGKTQQLVFMELKASLNKFDIDTSNLINELHYELSIFNPDHVFALKSDREYLEMNTANRFNAQIVLDDLLKMYNINDEARIWPHHFDTGVFIPVNMDIDGTIIDSIGIGYAVVDGMIEEPYYYVSFWNKNTSENKFEFEKLRFGNWMIPQWNGAVLKHSETILSDTAEHQKKLILSFFVQTMDILFKKTKKVINAKTKNMSVI